MNFEQKETCRQEKNEQAIKKLLDITLLDSIIITPKSYYSFAVDGTL